MELLQSCFDRADTIEPCLNALVARDDEAAFAAAQAAADAVARSSSPSSDGSGASGPGSSGTGASGPGDELGALHGLPLAVKDMHDASGLVTSYGAAPFANNIASEDDPMVARLRAAGVVIMGKTNTPELSIGANTANRLHGATTNPFNIDRTCGGSSGGSAVALATGMAALATGSDHGGSLRIPATFCGVVGHRSTPGTVPFEDRTMVQTNYSVLGPMGRTVADAALMLSVLARRDRASRRDPMAYPLSAEQLAQFTNLANVDLSKLRVGISADLGGLVVSQTVRAAFADRIERIAGLVGEVVAPALDLSDGPAIDWHIRADVFATHYHRSIDSFDHEFNPNVRATYDTALNSSVLDIARARRRQAELYAHMDAIFDECDVVLTPGVAVSPFDWHHLYPPEIDGAPTENYMSWLCLTSSFSVIGLPITAIPCGLDGDGLPFGFQVVGPSYHDARVMATAAAFEKAFAADPVMARPVPDIDYLAAATSPCRTEGKLVAESNPTT